MQLDSSRRPSSSPASRAWLAAAALAISALVARADDPPSPWGDVRVTRDGEGRVVRLDTPAGPFTIERDARGRRLALRSPDGVVERGTWDDDRLVSHRVERARGGAPLLEVTMVDAPDGGTVVTRTDDRDSLTAVHDDRGRLVAWDGLAEPVRVTWGQWGERRTVERGGRVRGATHDSGGRLVGIDDERLGHDRAGHVVLHEAAPADPGRPPRVELAWDAQGRLSEVRRQWGDRDDRLHEPEGWGRLIPGNPVRYGWDAQGRLAWRDDGRERHDVVRAGPHLEVDVLSEDRARLWILGPGGAPLAVRDEDGRWMFLHADERGTVAVYTDERGVVIARAVISPLGDVERGPGGGRPIVIHGRRLDEDTGLVLDGDRPWSPALGRFLAPDLDGEYGLPDEPPAWPRDASAPAPAPEAAPTRGLVGALGHGAR